MPSRRFFLLLVLLPVPFLFSRLAPNSGSQIGELTLSALRAVEANTMGAHDHHKFDDAPHTEQQRMPQRPEVEKHDSPRPGKRRADEICKTATYRKRPTLLMQKRVAVRYGFKCATCGKSLDETWELDHVIPLSEALSAAEEATLNSIENLQPLHRTCHQIKTSRENSKKSRNPRPRPPAVFKNT